MSSRDIEMRAPLISNDLENPLTRCRRPLRADDPFFPLPSDDPEDNIPSIIPEKFFETIVKLHPECFDAFDRVASIKKKIAKFEAYPENCIRLCEKKMAQFRTETREEYSLRTGTEPGFFSSSLGNMWFADTVQFYMYVMKLKMTVSLPGMDSFEYTTKVDIFTDKKVKPVLLRL